MTSSARYIRHWIEAMRGNSGYLLKAASQASRVTSYLLSLLRNEEQAVDEGAEAVAAG